MLDDALEHVYGVGLDEFIAERDRLAKEAAAAGDRETAAAIKSLRKPSVSAWAVNQLARRRAQEVDDLVHAHEQLLEASDPKDVREAQLKRKRAVAGLTDAAAEILEGAGHSSASGTLQRVSQTLLAASGGSDLEALRRGRLTADLEPSGFGAMAGFELAGESKPFSKPDGKARAEAQELDRRAVEAEIAAGEARRAAEAAHDEAERLALAADKAERRAETARRKAEQALDRLDR